MSPISISALASLKSVSDEVATAALREFFRAVLELDGPAELRRLYAAFYLQAHGSVKSSSVDWADTEGDGTRKVAPPLACSAGSGV